MNNELLRIFIGIDIPENIKDEIYRKINLPQFYKITKKENLHITLKFLGDIKRSIIPEISKIIKEAIKNYYKFEIEINNIGQFPEKGKPRIIFLTGDRGKEKLELLAKSINKNLISNNINFKEENDFKYHITIGRLKEYSKENYILDKNINLNLKFFISEIILYKSDLTKYGPIYTKLDIFKLNE